MLLLADSVAVVGAILSTGVVDNRWLSQAAWALFTLPLWVVAAKIYGLYDRDHRVLRHLTIDELPVLLAWSATGATVSAIVLHLLPSGSPPLEALLWIGGIAVVSTAILRSVARCAWRWVTPPERTVLIGQGRGVDAIRRKLELFEDIHVDLVAHCELLGAEELSDPPEWLLAADRLIAVAGAVDEDLIDQLVALCRSADMKLSVVPPAPRIFGAAARLRHIADLPIIEYNTWDVSRSTLLLKRCLDLVVALAILLAFAPLVLAVAGAIAIDSRGPVFFRQSRAGQNMRPFTMYKFRTMVSNAEDMLPSLVSFDNLKEPVFKLTRDPRVTRVGRFLRRWSIDEVPQLINVLKGDMSLVGPRPEQFDLVERYAPEHMFRLAVKPGMTGPMQTFGRGRLTFAERLAVERDYIENLSIGRDLRILALTIPAIAGGRGAF